ncbi:Mis6-domain-containing protein [Phaeosphaeria sp. MPI-PUGE-AT-0046c]|nr:Mis6-domain-containing protein [Phaeosphaeria sp. MPI-PUGE-AT-0046c]
MPSVVEDQPALQDALDLLHNASRTPAKQRTVKISSVIDVICRHAFDHGLETEPLRDIVQIVCVKTNLDQTTVTTLVKNLYPAQRLSADVVVTIVGALGQGKGKPSPSTQDSLVKWLAICHEILQDTNVLSRLYGVLFSMLDMISIRTSLCHLLSLITRRKHVKPFRIQQILELSRGLGNEPALQGLLRVFKDYYPDIILGSTSLSRKSFAPLPDTEWRTRIATIQNTSTAADDTLHDRHNGFKVSRKGPKRAEASAIPDVHTYHATEASVTLEGIDNVEGFVEKLDRIEPPGQMISFLVDPLLQKFVELRPSPITTTRIDLWLAICLEDLYKAESLGTGDPQYLGDIFAGLLKHAQCSKELHPAALSFMQSYLLLWNGQNNADTILALLTHVPFGSFPNAYMNYFQPVEQALASRGPSAYEAILDMYTGLLEQWAWSAKSQDASRNPVEDRVFEDFTEHVSTLSLSLLLSIPAGHCQSHISSILTFYEALSSTSEPHVVPILLPPTNLMYLLALHASTTTLSRTCGIIALYKRAFDLHPTPVKKYYPTAITDNLNWCLRDMYYMLWISRGLEAIEEKTKGLNCDPTLRSTLGQYLRSIDRDYSIGSANNLSNNPWIASLSASAWRAMEDAEIEREGFDRSSIRYHPGPVSQKSLDVHRRNGGVSVDWDGPGGYKVFVMKWLADRGLAGMRDLMFATVKDLKGKV